MPLVPRPLALLLVGACAGSPAPGAVSSTQDVGRPSGAGCDTSLVAGEVTSIRSLALHPTNRRLWPGVDTTGIRVATRPETCDAAARALARIGGARPDSVGVIALADSGYVVLVRGDMAGEWQMSYWFDARWAPRGPALGL